MSYSNKPFSNFRSTDNRQFYKHCLITPTLKQIQAFSNFNLKLPPLLNINIPLRILKKFAL